jgi:antitoxin (DNA-binding transcriptional repressor) of toxin-antitoxin stability system
MKTLQISKCKARCLGLLKEVHDTGGSIAITLRGETLAIIHPPEKRCRKNNVISESSCADSS